MSATEDVGTMTSAQERLYRLLLALATAGEVCPSNRVLAARAGIAATSTVADNLSRLKRRGLIAVHPAMPRGRIIALPELDLATAIPDPPMRRSRRPPARARREAAVWAETANPGALDRKQARHQIPALQFSGKIWVPPWHEADLRAALPVRREADAGRARHAGWRPGGCQYILKTPGRDEACKCRKPVVSGAPYCAAHLQRCVPDAAKSKAQTEEVSDRGEG